MATKLEIILELQNKIAGELKTVRGDLDKLTAAAGKTNTKLNNFDKSMKTVSNTANKLKAIILPLVGIALFVGAIKKLAEFEQAMANVRAVITPVTDELGNIDEALDEIQFEALTAEARRLGATTVFSASQAASGLEFLARAGFTANEAISALEGTLNLAAAGGIELGLAADIASNVLSGFNLEASEAGRVADVLAATAASANTNITQLGDAIKLVAPIAAAMGVELETAAAAIGKLSDAGLQGSLAGTGLRRVLATLNSPSAKLTKTMGELDLETSQVAVNGKNLGEVMGLLGKRGLTAAQALDLFGDRGAPAALAMANVSEELTLLNEQLLESEGRAEAMAAIMSDTLVGSFKQLNSAIEETLLQTGDAGLLGGLRDLVDTMSGVVRVLNGTQDPLDKNAVAYHEAANAVKAFGGFIAIMLSLKTVLFFTGLSGGLAKVKVELAAATIVGNGFAATLARIRIAAIALLLSINPLFAIAAIGAAFLYFATEDAPEAVDALKDIKLEVDALKQSLDGLDDEVISLHFETNAEERLRVTERISEIQDKLSSMDFIDRYYNGDELREEEAQLQATLTLLLKKRDVIRDSERQSQQAKDDAIKAGQANLARLEGEANEAELASVVAHRKAQEKITQQNLTFAKKVAKDRESIETEALKQQLAKQEINIEEYYFRIGLLADERFQADLDLLQAKQDAVLASQKIDLDNAEIARDAAVAESTTDAEVDAIERKYEAKVLAITAGYSDELTAISLGQQAVALKLAANDAKLETAEVKAIRDLAKKKATEQKIAFDKELARILEARRLSREATTQDVDAGTISEFQVGGRNEAADAQALVDLEALRVKTAEYNATVQDPNNVIAMGALDVAVAESSIIVDEYAQRIKTGLVDGLSDAFVSLADGSKSASEAFKDFADGFLRMILKMITEALVLQAINATLGAGGAGLFNGGGSVGASRGGYFGANNGGYIKAKTGGYVSATVGGYAKAATGSYLRTSSNVVNNLDNKVIKNLTQDTKRNYNENNTDNNSVKNIDNKNHTDSKSVDTNYKNNIENNSTINKDDNNVIDTANNLASSVDTRTSKSTVNKIVGTGDGGKFSRVKEYVKTSAGKYVEPQKFAEGGFITGKGSATSDDIPARLSNGEYVINTSAVNHYGLDFIEAVNRKLLPHTNTAPLPRFNITRPRRANFATGGSVDGQAKGGSDKSDTSIRVINNVDPDLVEGFMQSRDGEETILNLISNNTDKIKGMLG